jgi:preprotein translocase subunit SecD
MAVDANVLIYERIKEEQINEDNNFYIAFDNGYKKVLTTLLDANITTLIAGVLHFYYFGSGPIKGFAVTLTIGILTSFVYNLCCWKIVCL